MAQPSEELALAGIDEVHAHAPAGIVLPSRDLRLVIERTAGYVNRNGPAFETRIRDSAATNPRFSFILPNDPYNPFFQWRLSEIKQGRGTDVSAGREGETAVKEPPKPKGPEPPPDFLFSARMPNISAQDLDVVKLTALFAAKNGRSWMTSLSQREAGNYQFDFLRPNHSLYQFFTRLMDQYSLLLNGSTIEGGKPEQARIAELERNAKNKFNVLEKAKKRAEWVKYQEQQKAKKEEEAEKERKEFAEIDWHDFFIAGTLLFTEEDEHLDLPPPASLNDLQSASLEQKGKYKLAIEERAPTDDSTYYNNTVQPSYGQPPPFYPQQQPQQAVYPQQPQYPVQPAQDQEEEARIQEREAERERAQQAMAAAKAPPSAVRILPAAATRAAARRGRVQTAQCPNCKEEIPYDDLEQHMKGRTMIFESVSL
jgi:splicing factor 3A subunit 1